MLKDVELDRRLREIVAEVTLLPAESFGPDDDLSCAGVDSLSLLRVMAQVETEFGIVVPDEEFANLRTLSALHTLVGARALTQAGG